MIITHLTALTLAAGLDKIIGDPKSLPHPVVWCGRLINFLEKKLNRGPHRKFKGIIFLAIVVSIVFSVVFFLVYAAYQIHFICGIFVEALVISYAICTKSLKEAALEVYEPLKRNDLQKSRKKLSQIVGRDTDDLGETEIIRATVETVAENTSDGITAPLFYALFGGASLCFVYRAVNTCDSMVGYRNDRFREFGWASAKMDDVLNFIPARLSSVVMILVNRGEKVFSKKDCWRITKRDAKKHPSPNSGWLEAAFASLAGVQLGGLNYYEGVASFRPLLGEHKKDLELNHIILSVKMMERTVYSFIIVLWLLGGLLHVIA